MGDEVTPAGIIAQVGKESSVDVVQHFLAGFVGIDVLVGEGGELGGIIEHEIGKRRDEDVCGREAAPHGEAGKAREAGIGGEFRSQRLPQGAELRAAAGFEVGDAFDIFFACELGDAPDGLNAGFVLWAVGLTDKDKGAGGPGIEHAGMEDAGLDDLKINGAGAEDAMGLVTRRRCAGGIFGESRMRLPTVAP